MVPWHGYPNLARGYRWFASLNDANLDGQPSIVRGWLSSNGQHDLFFFVFLDWCFTELLSLGQGQNCAMVVSAKVVEPDHSDRHGLA